jgi:hypothetical protein
MQKDVVVGAVVLIAFVLIIVGYGALRPVAPQSATFTGVVVEHAPYYDIEAVYATTTPLTGAAHTKAVETMAAFIAASVAEFKENGKFAELTPQDISMMGYDQGRKQRLEISYATATSERTASYIYAIYMDTLGAHGNSFFKTFTFDTGNGHLLTLGDIFIPLSPYLQTLSSLSRAKLPVVMGESAVVSDIERGTEPAEENFANFFITDSEFVLLFPPYQIAAYAAGPQALRIPLSELASILKPEYQ